MQDYRVVAPLFAMLCVWSSDAIAQSWQPKIVNVTVGSRMVEGNALQPFHAAWTVGAATLDNRVVSLPGIDERLEAVTYEGRPAWRRAMTRSGDATHPAATQTNVLDKQTLSPLLTDEHHAEGPLLVLSFKRGRIIGRQSSPQRDRQIDARSQPAFDFLNGPAALILAALPLKENAEFVVPVLDVDGVDPGHVIHLVASVRFTEAVTAGSQKFDTFVVDVPTSYGMFKYWIAKKPPYAIRWIFLGPRGGRSLYTLDATSLS